MNIYAIISSFLFLLMSIIAYNNKYNVYSVLFLFLFITSLLYHYYSNPFTDFFDKIAIVFIVVYGGKIFMDKLMRHKLSLWKIFLSFLIITTFMLVVYCFINDYSSYLIHIISFTGHCGIIFM